MIINKRIINLLKYSVLIYGILINQKINCQSKIYFHSPIISYHNSNIYNDFEYSNIKTKRIQFLIDSKIYIPSLEIGYIKKNMYSSIGYNYFNRTIYKPILFTEFPENTLKKINYEFIYLKIGYIHNIKNLFSTKFGLITSLHTNSNIEYSCKRFGREIAYNASDLNKFKIGFELSIEKYLFNNFLIGIENHLFYKHKVKDPNCIDLEYITILNTSLKVGFIF